MVWLDVLEERAYSKLRKGRFGGMVRRSHPSAQQNRQVFLAHLCFIFINISSQKSDKKRKSYSHQIRTGGTLKSWPFKDGEISNRFSSLFNGFSKLKSPKY